LDSYAEALDSETVQAIRVQNRRLRR